jgi:hypothetical protein
MRNGCSGPSSADAEDRAEVDKVREFVGDTWDGIQ